MNCVLVFVVLALNVSLATAVPNQSPCARKFLSQESQTFDTADFIIYLETLISKRIIAIEDLVSFHQALTQNQIINPIIHEHLNQALAFHHNEFKKIIATSKLDPRTILKWFTEYSKKNKIKTDQQAVSTSDTQRLPSYTTPQGARFYQFDHSDLGPVYRILKRRGKFENQEDWEPLVWSVQVLKENKTDFRFSYDSNLEKKCKSIGKNSRLPSKEDYLKLISHFPTLFQGDYVHLTDEARKVFYQLFPDTDNHYFWTQSQGESTEENWLFDGIAGAMLSNKRIGIPRYIRCVGTWSEIKTK